MDELEKEEIPAHIREARLEALKKQSEDLRLMKEKQHGLYTYVILLLCNNLQFIKTKSYPYLYLLVVLKCSSLRYDYQVDFASSYKIAFKEKRNIHFQINLICLLVN